MKYDLNTRDVINIIANRLRIPRCNIKFSGNKDRKGITFQEIIIKCGFDQLFNYALNLSKISEYNFQSYGYQKFYKI